MYGQKPLFFRPVPGSVGIEQDTITFDVGESYSPRELNVFNMPNALAQVQSPEAAIRFVELFGPLLHFYEPLLEPADPAPDPVPAFMAHATAARFALRLLEAMQDDDDERLAHVLESAQILDENVKKRPANTLTRKFLIPEERFQRDVEFSASSWRKLAVTVVRYAVLSNTPFIKPHIDFADGGDRFERVIGGQKGLSLVEFVWYGVGEIALVAQETKQRRIRLCRECDTPFFALDGRQRFCPPDPGSVESRCGKRHQKRRIRARKRKER
jgi:hypothetical protein